MSRPFIDTWDREVWARTGYGESRGEGTGGIRAVMHAIYNRWRKGQWFSGHSMADCCMLEKQFSCWNDEDKNRRAINCVDYNDPLMDICRGMIGGILAGDTDPTLSATHYFSDTMETPPAWAATGIQTAKIGRHIFYKDVE